MPLGMSVLKYFLILLVVLVVGAGVLVGVRFAWKPPAYVFRKLMHTLAFLSATFLMMIATSWVAIVITYGGAAVGVWVLLLIIEKKSWYGRIVVEKSPGEVRKSLTVFYLMLAVMVAVGWGVLDRQAILATSILIWGFSDGAAALVGIPLGRHKVTRKLSDGCKSWEGTAAMCVTALIVTMLVLTLYGGLAWLGALVFAMIVAPIVSLVELRSPSEWDTVTVPLTAFGTLLLLYIWLG